MRRLSCHGRVWHIQTGADDAKIRHIPNATEGAALSALALILHGVGGRGAHLEALADLMAPHLPGWQFACPDAPQRYDWDDTGRQWFSVKDITPRNRPTRLRGARAGFDTTITHAIADAGFSTRMDRVAVIGFSQGAIMATDAVMAGRLRPMALAALSGRLVRVGAKGAALPFLISHGMDDPVIPPQDAIRAHAHWTANGADPELHLWPSLGHWFDARVAEVTARFLSRSLGG